MPFANRLDKRIWWLFLSKAADRSSKIIIKDLESALASLKAKVCFGRPHPRTVRIVIFIIKRARGQLRTPSASRQSAHGRDAWYTVTVKLPVLYFKRYDIILPHSLFHTLLFAICFSNCCSSGKCDTRTSEQHGGSNRLNY